MTRLLAAFAVAFALEATAGAQGLNPNNVSISNFNPEDSVAPMSSVEGPGVKVGEGTVLHPVFGIETGVISNVFYESAAANGAGLLRLLAQVGTGSLSQARLADGAEEPEQGSLQYRADLRASYDLMLTGNEAVSGTGGLGLGASLHLMVNPMGRFAFGADEDFTRLIRAANFETDANTNRDINNLGIKFLYNPPDRTIKGYLYYNNTIDIFERSEQRFADRMTNRLGLHPTWQWLPQTQVFLDASWGVTAALGSSTMGKVTSYPLALQAGIATLLTLKTTFSLYGGYTNGFYTTGPSYSAPMVGTSVGYRYSPLGRVSLQYALQYQDSINANYYRDHVVQVLVQHAFAPFLVMLQPEVHFRQYNGVTVVNGPMTRDDLILSAVGGIQYSFRNWLAASINYRFSTVQTDYRYMPIGGGLVNDPTYVRHELLFGMRAAL